MKLLAFAASLREGSLNRQLLHVAVRYAREAGAEVTSVHFSEFAAPLYNADVQDNKGFPAETEAMVRHIQECDGLIIASPEYNYSLPGTLKNAIDWVSRVKPMPLRGKTGFLISASTSLVGGIRGLWQLRIPLEGLGVHIMPDMYALPKAKEQFDEEGNLRESQRAELLERMTHSFVSVTERLIHEDGNS